MTLRVVGAGLPRTATRSLKEALELLLDGRSYHVHEVPADRLLECDENDGWEPLCRALALPVPDEPCPYRNTREEWLARDER